MGGEFAREAIQLRGVAYQFHPMIHPINLEARTWISGNIHSDFSRRCGNHLVIKPEHIGLIVRTTTENELKLERDLEVIGYQQKLISHSMVCRLHWTMRTILTRDVCRRFHSGYWFTCGKDKDFSREAVFCGDP